MEDRDPMMGRPVASAAVHREEWGEGVPHITLTFHKRFSPEDPTFSGQEGGG